MPAEIQLLHVSCFRLGTFLSDENLDQSCVSGAKHLRADHPNHPSQARENCCTFETKAASDHPAWEPVALPEDALIPGRVVWTARALV